MIVRNFALMISMALTLMLISALPSTVFTTPICSISSFAPARIYNSTLTPESLATGDFNGDGRPDIVAGNAPNFNGQGGVSVMLNNGVGGFGEAIFYPAGQYQPGVVTGDFNNDGKVDIAMSNYFSDTVSVLLGIGTGDFSAAINSGTGGLRPETIAAGDFNHDGKLDLAVSNNPLSGPGHNIAIIVGDGAGHFTVTTTIPGVAFLGSADFNSDGNLDLIGVTDQLRFYLGNSTGGFIQQPDVNTGILVTSFTIDDVNNDGAADIIAVSGSNSLSVVLGIGNGTFNPPTLYPINVVRVGSFVATGDINGDGHVDIASTNHDTNGQVHVLRGNSTGSFTFVGSYSTTVRRPLRISVTDFNGDERSDIAALNYDDGIGKVLVLLSTCLTPTPRYDFDGDGKSEVTVYRAESGFWYALRSSNNSLLAQSWGNSSDRVVAGDYDGDSKTDMAVYRRSSGTWYILQSTNSTIKAQAFGTLTDIPVPADYDGDGRADLAVYRSGAWYIQSSVDNSVLTQSFGVSSDRPMPADYDGDGKADLCVYRSGVWYIQQSSNSTVRGVSFGTTTDLPLTGDFDGDGRADVAVYRAETGTWYAFRSSNNSLLAQRWGISTDIPVAADYDGDAKTDLAVYRPTDGTWYILKSTDESLLARQFGNSSDVPVPSAYLMP
jgi:hypothetical protein